MSEAERLFLYDTTLRDGQQTQGVQFSTEDKVAVVKALDDLGIDYLEAGGPAPTRPTVPFSGRCRHADPPASPPSA